MLSFWQATSTTSAFSKDKWEAVEEEGELEDQDYQDQDYQDQEKNEDEDEDEPLITSFG
jgi:hypothetical protein